MLTVSTLSNLASLHGYNSSINSESFQSMVWLKADSLQEDPALPQQVPSLTLPRVVRLGHVEGEAESAKGSVAVKEQRAAVIN